MPKNPPLHQAMLDLYTFSRICIRIDQVEDSFTDDSLTLICQVTMREPFERYGLDAFVERAFMRKLRHGIQEDEDPFGEYARLSEQRSELARDLYVLRNEFQEEHGGGDRRGTRIPPVDLEKNILKHAAFHIWAVCLQALEIPPEASAKIHRLNECMFHIADDFPESKQGEMALGVNLGGLFLDGLGPEDDIHPIPVFYTHVRDNSNLRLNIITPLSPLQQGETATDYASQYETLRENNLGASLNPRFDVHVKRASYLLQKILALFLFLEIAEHRKNKQKELFMKEHKPNDSVRKAVPKQ